MLSCFSSDHVLEWRDVKLGAPSPGEVLIDVVAAGVNRPDLLQRAGLYPPPPGASEALGLEVSGRIAAVGAGVTRLTVGDEVMALVPGGGYSQQVLADEGAVMAKPSVFSFAEAAAFPETAFTVFANVIEHGALKTGERLFVHGATSGIGTMAISMAKALGHEVYGTAGTAAKAAEAAKLGYDKVWNYREDDWSAEMLALGGCDVVLDMVGGDYVPRNLAMLREGGRHVSIAFLGGIQASISILDLMQRRLSLTGSTLRARSLAEKARLRAALEQRFMPLVEIGKIKPLVTLEVPWARTDDAHQAMQSGELLGKAVLLMEEANV